MRGNEYEIEVAYSFTVYKTLSCKADNQREAKEKLIAIAKDQKFDLKEFKNPLLTIVTIAIRSSTGDYMMPRGDMFTSQLRLE